MATLLELVNEVLRRCGQEQAATLANAATPVLQTRDFLNETYFEMLQRLNVHRLLKTGTFNTVAGTSAYSLAADATIDSLEGDSVLETGSQKLLTETDTGHPQRHGIGATGRPAVFYRMGSQLHLYPIPDAVYTLQYRYQVVPVNLTADNEVSLLPAEWEKVLVLGTQARLEKFLGEPAESSYLLYRDGLLQLKSRAPLRPFYRMRGEYRGGRTE